MATMPTSIVTPVDQVVLNHVQQAGKDLALYSAIVGHTPRMSRRVKKFFAADPQTPAEPGRVSVWVRSMSDNARKRIHEAMNRLAS